MNVAHIINRPGHEVGDKALALCGVKHKVKIKWEDLDPDHPICRDCVDTALACLSDVTNQVAFATRRALLLFETLTDPHPWSDLVDEQREYTEKQEAKAIAKAEKKAAKKEAKREREAEVERVPVAPPLDLEREVSDEDVEEFFGSLTMNEKRRIIEKVAQNVLADKEE